MTTTFSHPTTSAARTGCRIDRPTMEELILAAVSRNPRRPYTGAPADASPSWLASTINRLRNHRLQPTETAGAPNVDVECRSPEDCESAEEAMRLAGRRILFVDRGRIEYGTIVGAHDSPGGIPEFVVSTDTGTAIKFGDEFKLSQLPEELLAS